MTFSDCCVLALAKVMLANPSARVDEVQRRPVVVVEGTPDCVVAVDRDRVFDLQLPHRATDVVDVSFEGELRCVHADGDEILPVLLRPGTDVRERAQPVDAGIRPELRRPRLSLQDLTATGAANSATPPPHRWPPAHVARADSLPGNHPTCRRPAPSRRCRANAGGHGRFAPSRHISHGCPVDVTTLLQSASSGSIFLRAETAREIGTWVK